MSAQTIWTGTHYHVQLRDGHYVASLIDRDAFTGDVYFGATRKVRATQRFGVYSEGRFVPTETAEDVVIKWAQERDTEATWITGHPGVLADVTAQRDPFVPADLPADS